MAKKLTESTSSNQTANQDIPNNRGSHALNESETIVQVSTRKSKPKAATATPATVSLGQSTKYVSRRKWTTQMFQLKADERSWCPELPSSCVRDRCIVIWGQQIPGWPSETEVFVREIPSTEIQNELVMLIDREWRRGHLCVVPNVDEDVTTFSGIDIHADDCKTYRVVALRKTEHLPNGVREMTTLACVHGFVFEAGEIRPLARPKTPSFKTSDTYRNDIWELDIWLSLNNITLFYDELRSLADLWTFTIELPCFPEEYLQAKNLDKLTSNARFFLLEDSPVKLPGNRYMPEVWVFQPVERNVFPDSRIVGRFHPTEHAIQLGLLMSDPVTGEGVTFSRREKFDKSEPSKDRPLKRSESILCSNNDCMERTQLNDKGYDAWELTGVLCHISEPGGMEYVWSATGFSVDGGELIFLPSKSNSTA